MTDLHITEIIALLGLCLGYLVVTIGNAIAFRIRYGKLTPGSLTPHEIDQAVADAKATRRRRKRESETETTTPASVPTLPTPTPSTRDGLELELELRGIATPIARAAAKHARAALGECADASALVREALRACPGRGKLAA